jgi:hypothetical protein
MANLKGATPISAQDAIEIRMIGTNIPPEKTPCQASFTMVDMDAANVVAPA